jgi:voltage-gated potassium channel Kch
MKHTHDPNRFSTRQFYKDLLRELFSVEIRNLFFLVTLFVGVGTIFYQIIEKWSWVDSFYFSVMTLTTVGYGDLTPQTTAGKLFTTAFVFGGLGIVFTFLTTLAKEQAKEPFFMRLLGKTKHK